MEKASLRDMIKMNKEHRGSSDVVTDVSSEVTVVRWRDNIVMIAISIFTEKQPIQQAKHYCHREKRRGSTETT